MKPIDVLTLGETMVALRADGSLRVGGNLTLRLAGAESNVAIGLARLGHAVAWAGRVGADPFGDLILRELRAEGVDISSAGVDPTRPTGLMIVEERTADLMRVEYRRTGSAGSALSRQGVLPALECGPRIVHVTGITPALSASAGECAISLVAAARAAGVLVSVDVNYRSRLWSRDEARDQLTALVAHADVVIASDDELDLVAEGQEAEAVSGILARGADQVAVTRGSRGASLYTDEGRVDAAARRVTAVDPIGAGDAFAVGLLSGLLDGLGPEARLERAIVCGAFAVSSRGDWEGAPTRAELTLLEGANDGTTLR